MAATETLPDQLAGRDECLVRLAAAEQKITNLEAALLTGRRIGTAVGIIMATYKVSDDAAFDLLVMASQNSHR